MFRINIGSILANLLRKMSAIVMNWDIVNIWDIYLIRIEALPNLNTFDEKLPLSFEDRKKIAEFKFAALIVKKIFRFKRQNWLWIFFSEKIL